MAVRVSEFLKPLAKTPYTELVAALKEGNPSTAQPKRSAGKVVPVLKQLALYDVEPSLAATLAQYLDYEEPQVARLVYFLLSRMVDRGMLPNHEDVVTAVRAELDNANVYRRTDALRLYARLVPADAVDSKLVSVVQHKLLHVNDADAVPKRKFSIVRKTATEDEMRGAIQRECLAALLARKPQCIELLDDIVGVLKSVDRTAARHAAHLLVGLVPLDAHRVLLKVQPFWDSMVSTKKSKNAVSVNLGDPLCGVYFCRLLGLAAVQPDETLPWEQRYAALSALAIIMEKDASVAAIEAVRQLCQSQFPMLSREPAKGQKSLLQRVVARCEALLKEANDVLLRPLCVSLYMLARALPETLDGAAHPFRTLFEPITQCARKGIVYVRSAALATLIQIVPGDEQVAAMISREIRAKIITRDALSEIFRAMVLRAQSKRTFVKFLIPLARLAVEELAREVDPNALLGIWDSCASDKTLHVTLLELLLTLLDIVVQNDDIQNAQLFALEYMSQHATDLVGDVPPGGATARTLYADDGYRFDTSNMLMKAVLLRLQHVAFTSPWEMRCAAVRGLVTIALRSHDPVRLAIYEALAVCRRDESLGLAQLLLPAMRLLDDIYATMAAYIEARDAHTLDKAWVRAEHARLMAQANLFCAVDRNHAIIHPDTAALVRQDSDGGGAASVGAQIAGAASTAAHAVRGFKDAMVDVLSGVGKEIKRSVTNVGIP